MAPICLVALTITYAKQPSTKYLPSFWYRTASHSCVLCLLYFALKHHPIQHSDFIITGISVKMECGTFVVRATLLMCSVDLPARCLCANMKQFNGKHGCVYCENPGSPRENMPRVRDWLPGSHSLRTHSSFVHHAQETVSSGEVVCMLHKA